MKRVIILTVGLTLVFSMCLYSNDSKSIEKKFKLQVRVDENKGFTTYMPKSGQGRSRIFLYIVKNNANNNYFLRLRIAYFANAMLLMKKYIFTVDGEEHVVPVRGIVRMQSLERMNLPGHEEVRIQDPEQQDVEEVAYTAASGGICEYYDIAMNTEEIEIMKKIAASKKVKLRYEGTKGFKNMKIHKAEVKDIKLVLDAFEEFTK
jgi:hypothetical protein